MYALHGVVVNSPSHPKPANGEKAVEDEQEDRSQDACTCACM
jgi:hypothetical protein